MAKKIASAALLVMMCLLVFVAAIHHHVPKVDADHMYGHCFTSCLDNCDSQGQGYTFCEMKCDTDCFNEEVTAKLNIKFSNKN
ncbi:hypothetical protein Dsin_029655 [Dipteronia sinensis]|uniref:Major pollen allergen Ole e 6-like n=1 Tax=Dipteronia sinensis TaxID=43782 RepID=A0AAD9ZTH5_9ROSI|nr:hypothetical protein Dsin_029655 [Dipteronia sinensis]